LYPVTIGGSKQLMPVYDKPMIYYPLSLLLLAGIKDILIISTPEDLPRFKNILRDGNELGVNFSYKVQPSPDGLAQAFIIGEEFIGDDDVCLALGDNIFYGHGLTEILEKSVEFVEEKNKAVIFGYYVKDPERYGVASFDDNGNVVSIIEKSENPGSNYAVVGLYFYPNSVINIAKQIKPSARGELEITSVNQAYLEQSDLKLEIMGRGYAWLDTGTHDSLLEASNYIQTIENRQGLKVACLEEIAFEKGYINKAQFTKLAKKLEKSQYGQYLMRRVKEGVI